MARRSIRSWVVGLAVVLVGVAIAVALVVRRGAEQEARSTAARLLGCTAVDVEWTSLTDTTRWRVEGCGMRGLMVCEPDTPGCYITADE